MSAKNAKRIAFLVALGGLAALFVLAPVRQWLEAFVTWAEGAGAWGPIVLAAAYVPATILMIPGTILTLGAGFAFGILVGTALVSVGSVLGSVMAFYLGRTVLRDWVAEKLKDKPRLRAVDEAVGSNGLKIVTLIRLSPAFPYNLMGYVFGVTRVTGRDHLFGSWIGMLPGTVLYVYLGYAARQAHNALNRQASMGQGGSRTTGEWALLGVGLLATIIVTVIVTRVARRAIQDAVPESPEASEQVASTESVA